MTNLVTTLLDAIRTRTPTSDDTDTTTETDTDAPVNAHQGPVSVDEATDVLRDARRRWLIEDLDANGASTLHELADRRSRFVYGPGYSSDERKREYVSMYQTHLPVLDDAGVVVFKPQDGHTVSPGPRFDAIVDALEALDARFNTDAQTPVSPAGDA